ncbi:hypothetical protein ACX3O0_06750 [Homoserinimonas sp. A447]
MDFERIGLIGVLVVVFLVLPWWLISNAIERRDQRRAAAAEQAAYEERAERMEQLGQDLVDRFGPLSAAELEVLWKVMLGSIAVSGSVGLRQVEGYVPLVRQLTKTAQEELMQQGIGPEDGS